MKPGGHFSRREKRREAIAWLQAGRTLKKNTACLARPALFWLNPVLFSSLEVFPGFELHLPKAHTPLPATGEAADHRVPGR